jgi:hypothetical protein
MIRVVYIEFKDHSLHLGDFQYFRGILIYSIYSFTFPHKQSSKNIYEHHNIYLLWLLSQIYWIYFNLCSMLL